MYSSIISSASNLLCTGTPTADFAAIFSSVAATVAPATTGATILSDQFLSQSAVSLYYTATGSQGPGAITGSATAATKSAGESTALTTLTGSNSATVSLNTGNAETGAATGSSSNGGAIATQGVGFGGIVAAIGGLAVVAL